jgi:hypothetical protein
MTAERDDNELTPPDLEAVMASPGVLLELPDDEPVAGTRDAESDVDSESRSVATRLVDLALERYSLGVTPDGEPYALPAAGGHVVTMLRDGRASLRAELAREFFRDAKKVPSSSALTDAMGVLTGYAREQEPVDLHLRTASHQNAVYIDLGDQDQNVVRVTPEGWSIVNSGVPVRFRRTGLTGAFPLPQPAGSLADLWPLLNIDPDDRVLLLAFMVAALIQPDAPHPVLTFFAEQGSGKSSATRRIVELLDPSPVPLRKAPRDPDSWVVAASGSWVVALDNLSSVKEWLSDALCRACTGEGDVRRRLYTDTNLAVIKFRRCIIANGIDVGALRGDLSERLLSVPLYPIPDSERLLESAIEEEWASVYPGVLGALLDLCVAAKAALPEVVLPSYPRMADFARLLAAIDTVLHTEGLKRYLHRTDSAATDSLSADPSSSGFGQSSPNPSPVPPVSC